VYHAPVRAPLRGLRCVGVVVLSVGLVALFLAPVSCAGVPPPVIREVRVRSDRRVARENRALRREVRALRQELVQARAAGESEAAARRREGEVQSAIVAGLAQQIQVLARTIGDLEQAIRAQTRAEVGTPPRGRAGAFSKLRVGAVPAQSPTLPEPRDRMDQPDRAQHPPDLLDPFSKAPSAGP
jgi:hypothetical protein